MKYHMLITWKDRTGIASAFPTAGELPEFRLVEITEDRFDELRAIIRKEIGRVDCVMVGEDHFLYRLTADGFTLATEYKKYPFSAQEWAVEHQKNRQKAAKENKKRESLLQKYGADVKEEHGSLLPYKPGYYVSKTHQLCFPFRVKYAKKPGQPLLVFFHGGGGNGTDNFKPLWEYLRGPYPEFFPWLKRKGLFARDFTVLIPQGSRYADYELETYVTAVKELSEKIAADAQADLARVYCMGGSAGGRSTWLSAYLFPDYYACAMPMMGALLDWGERKPLTAETLAHMKDLPVWVSHSADDATVPIDRDDEAVAVLRALGAPVKYTRVNGKGHHYLVAYFLKTELWAEWMFEQRKNR